MNFSIEIGPHTDLETLPSLKEVYITLLPGGDYVETAQKAGDLVKKGFNAVPHFPARSIADEAQLNDYVSRCKDLQPCGPMCHTCCVVSSPCGSLWPCGP